MATSIIFSGDAHPTTATTHLTLFSSFQRFELEKTMKFLPHGLNEEDSDIWEAMAEEMKPNGSDSSFGTKKLHLKVSSWFGGSGISPGDFRAQDQVILTANLSDVV
ncbi:hypothetical protein HHK36_006699 [Tetracentron sinense]|uniref:Uncharacterized protein n=1 Tax=Tetracentron sinense TaxID=13715 RepID=A0A834ZL09_TETSI|nr:hypothetical protein HHK36_006699 [Tetracentron sinense]